MKHASFFYSSFIRRRKVMPAPWFGDGCWLEEAYAPETGQLVGIAYYFDIFDTMGKTPREYPWCAERAAWAAVFQNDPVDPDKIIRV